MAEIDDRYEYIIGRNQKRFITSRVMRKVMNLIYIYNLCFMFLPGGYLYGFGCQNMLDKLSCV